MLALALAFPFALHANNEAPPVAAEAVMPELITGAQLAFGNAWRALIAAEMVIGFGTGIGQSLAYACETADMIGVMMNILAIGILAPIIDQLILENLKQRVLRYQYV
jgi:NitT/TauT family transport system permease protein